MFSIRQKLSDWLVRYLSTEVDQPLPVTGLGFHWLEVIQPGDVLLVEGRTRVSTAIKYLTQSTWSHAALVTDTVGGRLVEADVKNGVVFSDLTKYADFNVRICRPIGLSSEDAAQLVSFAESQVGLEYDLKNLIDLARYLIPTPPVPAKYRRDLIAFGSGEPTQKLICSALIARAFQAINYPILPLQTWNQDGVVSTVRHYSLYMPRDFDLSPFFQVIKPTAIQGFNYQEMVWKKE